MDQSSVSFGSPGGKPRSAVPPSLARLPLVGRSAELTELRAHLERARAGQTSILLLRGDPGVGKSRLAAVTADEARRSGWTVASGRAYRVEAGAPYATFSDAFVPLLNELDPARLAVLARGASAQLERLFPALGYGRERPASPTPPADRTQLFWTFAEILRGLSERQPLLILLDDLHWADASSLELLHFLARQLTHQRIALVATLNDAELASHTTLATTIQSLLGLGVLKQRTIQPLSREETDELVRQVFGIDERVSREFTALLFGWTRGNPYFIEETLKTLVESGRLRSEGGSWLGWEVAELELPGSVRDALRLRLTRLSPAALQVAELLAVLGARAPYDALRSLSGLDEAELVRALEELGAAQVVHEGGSTREPLYDFVHPMVAQTVHSGIALARRRIMHAAIAEALEKKYGERAAEHSDELARHYAHGDAQQLSPKAVKYLTAAGRSALARFANQEAADYLTAALERLDDRSLAGTSGAADGEADRSRVLDDLARARLRLGEVDEAMRLFERARAAAEAAGDQARAASVLRRIGLAHFRAGSHKEALEAFGRALAAITEGGEGPRPTSVAALAVRTRIVRGVCLQTVGRVDEARLDLEAALAEADAIGDPALRARSHRALLLFHGLAGPQDRARAHGERAIALAEASGDRGLASSCHTTMAVLEGLTSHSEALDFHVRESARIAEELNSPILRLSADELQVEHAYGRGDWDTGVAIGERAIALARALNQRGLLPRLLVWTAIIHLGRDELERAKQYFDEAWALAGADDLTRVADIHNVVPVHIGMAAYHMHLGQCDEAVRIGRRGLAIVDRAGFTTWAVHRLLPIIGEAQLIKGDIAGARETLGRLRDDARKLDHQLGLAWADAAEGVAMFLAGDIPASLPLMRQAADHLERVPYIPYAARLRRQLAARLADVGERDAAIRELRHVHEVFVRLGAKTELEKTRVQLQELGARPPSRSTGGGTETLTEREVEIVRLVSEHMSNKAIGKALGISPRTVGTHLSNIYGKLDIASRAELAARAPVILSGA